MVDDAVEPRGLRRTFQSLAIRNYRLFFIGQTVSVVGTWMQRVVQDWLILQLGGGPVELAVGVALQSAPALLFGVWGGLLVDRVARTRSVLLVTQVLLGALAVLLGVLILADRVNLVIVYLSALGVGCVATVDTPARQTFVLDMVGREQAANAVSLNSSINSSARLVGPAIGGVLIGVVGTGMTYLLNAGTFVAIIVTLLLMDKSQLHAREPVLRDRGQVRSAVRYSRTHDVIRTSLLATLLVSLFAQNFRVVLPLLVVRDFDAGAKGYGGLMSALGAGALVGALVCAHLARPSLRLIGRQLVGFGAAILLAALAPTYLVMAVLLVAVGAGSTSFNTTSSALVLVTSEPQMRGRVLSIRTLLSRGATPIGSLGIGWICAVADPRLGLIVGGTAAIVCSLLTVRVRHAEVPTEPAAAPAPAPAPRDT